MPKRYFIKNIGVVKGSGKDLIDFINRMSTNDFRKFSENEFRKTILTTDKGRIIDLINVLNLPSENILLTSNNFQNKVISHFSKYIITDDVNLEEDSDKYYSITITGGELFDLAKNLFDISVEKNKVYNPDENVYIFIDDFRFETLNLICKSNKLESYSKILNTMEEISVSEYEYKRIESGIPAGENEFNEQINPVECGLERYISYNKGCYIGQEVIARLDSQGKKPKQMVKLNSTNNINIGDKIFTLDGKEAGFITSVIKHEGKYWGLGFIRTINLDFGTNYFGASKDIINIFSLN